MDFLYQITIVVLCKENIALILYPSILSFKEDRPLLQTVQEDMSINDRREYI